ncbi:endolytic transglycosylase MltG [Saccharicrinis aurantiacus]|uniref:endolytic transglycosylase MltG n=1 Tax=Saccharicrinis aurantiacus TaxID=1849719 RepID=UPI0024915499|nr:endolytic transglycosylase MltG [Saccharicrinis aurantiacus]
MGKKTNRKIKKKVKRLGLFLALIVIVIILVGGRFYKFIYGTSVVLDKPQTYLHIGSNDGFKEVCNKLVEQKIVSNIDGFIWVAERKSYPSLIKTGRYKIANGMNNNELVNMLRLGIQDPINVVFNNIRTIEELSGSIAGQLMLDSVDLLNLLTNKEYLKEINFTESTLPALFIPNTYQMYWDTDAKEFVARMQKEYKKFWNASRVDKAKAQGLTPVEVTTLAAIVDEETVKADEKPKVAGLYLNRLNKNIRLQADPTLKYALGDFTIKRLLNKDMKIDSPYNTYMYAGLPPGPIRISSIQGIDAVLNPTEHRYLYMCAKEDFSGYHNFAKTLTEHNKNARKYQNELRKRGIRR